MNELIELYAKWCATNNVPHISADELAYPDAYELTNEQREWLNAFIILWDLTEK